jgi:hypothetical protein
MNAFVVYVWMTVAYMPWDIVKVGEFANCEQGIATANNLYPGYVALHCITPDLVPPGGFPA